MKTLKILGIIFATVCANTWASEPIKGCHPFYGQPSWEQCLWATQVNYPTPGIQVGQVYLDGYFILPTMALTQQGAMAVLDSQNLILRFSDGRPDFKIGSLGEQTLVNGAIQAELKLESSLRHAVVARKEITEGCSKNALGVCYKYKFETTWGDVTLSNDQMTITYSDRLERHEISEHISFCCK